ncbi:MAG: DUF4349 domain-containing protein [Oscillospiraceae bacterium]
MKKWVKRAGAVMLALILAISAAACSSSGTYENLTTTDGNGQSYEAGVDTTADTGNSSGDYGSKIVYSAQLQIETIDYETSISTLKDAIQEYGGYIESSNTYGGYSYSTDEVSSRIYSATVRIPVENYQDFMNSASNFGNVTSKTESSEDVTSAYLDIEARLEALESQRERLLALEEQAQDMSSLLEIESQLSDVQYEIENYTSQKNYYDNKVNFSTVEIDIEEVTKITEQNGGFWSRLGNAFTKSISDLGAFFEGLIVVIVYLLPFLAIIAVIVIIIVAVSRKKKKKRIAAAQNAQAVPGTAQTGNTAPQNYQGPERK